jgi:CHAD domain-containing protein
MVKALADLQDALGHMNDQAVAHRLIEGIDDTSSGFALAEAAIHGWLAAVGVESERRLGGRLENLAAVKRFW